MKKVTRKMYFVLTQGQEDTIAICDSPEKANWIAANYPADCIVRTSQF